MSIQSDVDGTATALKEGRRCVGDQRSENHNKFVDQHGHSHTIKQRNGSHWDPRGRRTMDAGVVTDYCRYYRSVSKVTSVEIGVA